MKRTFTLQNIQPFSINSSYYGTGRGFVKTSALRDWTAQFFYRLAEFEPELRALREAFDPFTSAYKVEITAYYPAPKFKTKKGGLSAKTMDLSNCEKSIIDCLFLPKFFNTPSPYGAENLNTDDKHLVEMVSRKRSTDSLEHSIEITIEILAL